MGALVALAGLGVLLGAGVQVLSAERSYVAYLGALCVAVLGGVLTLGATLQGRAGRQPAATTLARVGGMLALGGVLGFAISVVLAFFGADQGFALVLFSVLGLVLSAVLALLAQQTYNDARHDPDDSGAQPGR